MPMETDATTVVFLGVCERVAYVREGVSELFKWNFLGLKSHVLSLVYPLPLTGVHLALAIRGSSPDSFATTIQVVDEKGAELGTIKLGTAPSSADEVDLSESTQRVLLVPAGGWCPVFVRLGSGGLNVMEPGTVFLRALTENGPQPLGQLLFLQAEALPLTPERIVAIKANPAGAKAVRMEWGCKVCATKLRGFAALERNHKLGNEGWTWYEDLPGRFVCECGKTNFSIESARRNLCGFLGNVSPGKDQLQFVPLYERSSLQSVNNGFRSLLADSPSEEQVQRYIAANPTLLHQFPATKIFPKPDILNRFVADFAVLAPNKELLLIEIEKPSTALLNKNGGMAAPLTHAFEQVRDWLQIVNDHRLAVLECLRLEKADVGSIRGLVIAGRDGDHDPDRLRKLKGSDYGNISFLTYDDVVAAMDSLIERFGAL